MSRPPPPGEGKTRAKGPQRRTGDSSVSLLHCPSEAATCVRSHISPGPYRSFRELSLAGPVGPDIWCPPTFVGNSGIECFNGVRGFALWNCTGVNSCPKILASKPSRLPGRRVRSKNWSLPCRCRPLSSMLCSTILTQPSMGKAPFAITHCAIRALSFRRMAWRRRKYCLGWRTTVDSAIAKCCTTLKMLWTELSEVGSRRGLPPGELTCPTPKPSSVPKPSPSARR